MSIGICVCPLSGHCRRGSLIVLGRGAELLLLHHPLHSHCPVTPAATCRKHWVWDLLEKPFLFAHGSPDIGSVLDQSLPCQHAPFLQPPAALGACSTHVHTINSVRQGILPEEVHGWDEGRQFQLQSWSLQVNTGKYTHSHPPQNLTNQPSLSGKCGTSGMVWRHGMKFFSGSFDSKCLRKQGIQVARS